MNRLLLALVLGATLFSAPASAQVSVSIGQPGFYGRINVGGIPEPTLLFSQPMMIQHVPVGRPPLYLRVPPGHSNNWGRHCGRYRACGERVYFVRDDWYSHEYAPRYREQHGHGRPNFREVRHDDRRDYREDRRHDRRDFRNDRRDDHRDHRRGGGDRGHGRGHD